MNQLFHELFQRKNYLEKLLSEVTRELEASPQGKLRVSNDRGNPRYFHMTKPKDTHGKYILQEDMKLAYQLAQKDYAQKLSKKVTKELEDINHYLSNHKQEDLEKVFSNLNQYRKKLVTPVVISDAMFIEEWEREEYGTNPYCPEEKVYETKRGDYVRSKSEVMLADMYFELGIPYRYEAQLCLKNGKKKYPDFTLLKVATREVMYHEHMGLLDNDEYRQANLLKLDEYRKSKIYLGKNLILTFEAEGCYINMKEIKEMIKDIFFLPN